ncbi:unnamed protein product [Strongylus vulgaris]|uniref:Uncharacterized protein n=1 Tax=Strongylus vulgaris TaxID=40348 RepID=A0A3P7KAR3_STRVU|nr:unnamed protein product [Strongylus vulgaris]
MDEKVSRASRTEMFKLIKSIPPDPQKKVLSITDVRSPQICFVPIEHWHSDENLRPVRESSKNKLSRYTTDDGVANC